MIVSEFSCGGVILDGRKVLLVQVKNMKGKKIWTFPKGHIEAGVTPRQAALREALEAAPALAGVDLLYALDTVDDMVAASALPRF